MYNHVGNVPTHEEGESGDLMNAIIIICKLYVIDSGPSLQSTCM